jgi:hypothetical protein
MALIDVNGKRFKSFMAKLYGWGASVVILGALFKILHLPGADIMLILGLGTESVIFFFSAFEKPSEEHDWTLVYPELAGMEDPDLIDSRIEGNKNQLTATQELDNMLEEAKIDSELMQSLGDGMRKLSDTAGNLSSTVDAAGATQEYSTQLNSAAKNMESLNALYQVQLDNSKTQVEIQNTLMERLGDSVGQSENLATEVAQLAKNITNLNNVYGGMLSAMTVKG